MVPNMPGGWPNGQACWRKPRRDSFLRSSCSRVEPALDRAVSHLVGSEHDGAGGSVARHARKHPAVQNVPVGEEGAEGWY